MNLFCKEKENFIYDSVQSLNINVLDLEKSLKFYKDTLNLEPVREKNAADGSFKLVYLGDGSSNSPWNSPGSVTATNHIISVNANFILLS